MKLAKWMALIMVLAGGFRSTHAATRQELDTVIATAEVAVNKDVAQGIEVINALSVVTAPKQSLTVGQVGGTGTVSLPVYFKASTAPVAGVQFDVVLSSGLTPIGVTPGIAAQAAGKSVQGNAVQTGFRIIVFGLNQIAIPSGPVAVITMSLGGNVGKIALPIINLSGASPSGVNVPLTGKGGSVTIQ